MSLIKKDATAQQNADAYWKDTLKLLWIVLALWAVVSYFAGIFFALWQPQRAVEYWQKASCLGRAGYLQQGAAPVT